MKRREICQIVRPNLFYEDEEEENLLFMGLHGFVHSLSPMEEQEFHLDQLALPDSMDELKGTSVWRKLPQRTRIAIWTLQRQF